MKAGGGGGGRGRSHGLVFFLSGCTESGLGQASGISCSCPLTLYVKTQAQRGGDFRPHSWTSIVLF